MIGYKLLIAILNENNLELFSQLKENIFTPSERQLYKVIKDYLEKYQHLPSIRVLSEIVDEEFVIPEAPAESLFEQIRFRYFTDDLSQLSNKLESILSDQNIEEALNLLSSFVVKHSAGKNFKEIYYLDDLKTIVQDYIEKRRKKFGSITGITTGWRTLDQLTNGFQPGDLNVIVARPKKGKSLVLAFMAVKAYQAGHRTMLISMEMGVLQQAKRIIAIANNLNFSLLQEGTVSSFAEDQIKTMPTDGNFLYVEGQFNKTIHDIEAIILKHQPEILYIDGGYLITFSTKFRSLWENISETAKELKLCAMKFQIPIVVSFQFNRQIPKKDSPGLEHIQLSDAIGQLASIVLTISEEDNSKERTVELLANREGLTDAFKINWDWETMNFEEV